MSDTANAVQTEIERQQVASLAAKEITRSSLSLGWKLVIGGWFLPIIPIIGFFLMIPAALAAFFIGLMAASKGNVGGGLKLIVAAWLGTGLAAVIWMGIYALVVSAH